MSDPVDVISRICDDAEGDKLERITRVLFPSGAAHEPPAAPKQMRMAYQLQGRCMWHEDCEKSRCGIMREIAREESRSMFECLHCGQRGYYPVGAVGAVCVDVVGSTLLTPPVRSGQTITAQHDETGRWWRGPRGALPKGYTECSGSPPVVGSLLAGLQRIASMAVICKDGEAAVRIAKASLAAASFELTVSLQVSEDPQLFVYGSDAATKAVQDALYRTASPPGRDHAGGISLETIKDYVYQLRLVPIGEPVPIQILDVCRAQLEAAASSLTKGAG